jgi:F-type H+-transporting ATPase subunit a
MGIRSRAAWRTSLLTVLTLLAICALPRPVFSEGVNSTQTVAAHEPEAATHEDAHPELPNLVSLLFAALGGEEGQAPGWLSILYRFQDVFFALLVALVIIAVVRLGTRRMTAVPGRLQAAVELFIDGFRGFIVGILGPGGERYVPFLGTLFLYIWFMNLFGLIPLMKSPTSVLSTTAALAVCVFLYVQWIGIRRLGPGRYLRHLAGDPRDVIGWTLVPLMLPLHIISEFAKPVSLSLRLFGNILGEDVLMAVFAGLGVAVLAFSKLPIGVPLHLPFMLLALLMSTVQALVFTLLSTIYIMQVLPHGEDEDTGPRSEGAQEDDGAHWAGNVVVGKGRAGRS